MRHDARVKLLHFSRLHSETSLQSSEERSLPASRPHLHILPRDEKMIALCSTAAVRDGVYAVRL